MRVLEGVMEFKREKILLNKLIIVDGIGKCGKSLMLDVLSCFDSVEKQEFNGFLEYIALAYKYNKITADMAKAILQTEMDTRVYNNMIGRDVNTRLSDDTSLYKYHSPSKYLKRSLEGGGPSVYGRVLLEKPINICWAHDLINKSEIIFEAYEHRLDWIYINRKPVDIIFDWIKEQYSQRMAQEPTEMQYNVRFSDKVVPEIALGWEEEFLNITPHERTVKMIHTCFTLNREALKKKQYYKNLYVFNFEDLVVDPHKEIERLKTIVKNPILPVLNQVLAKAKCPRVINKKEWVERENDIIKNVSKQYADLLLEMDVMYGDIKNLSIVENNLVTSDNS